MANPLGGYALSLYVDQNTQLPGDLIKVNLTNLSSILSDNLPLHATRHSDGGVDPITVENLATGSVNTAQVLKPDGAGGLSFGADTGGVFGYTVNGGLYGDNNANTVANYGVQVGTGATVGGSYSIAIGRDSLSYNTDSIAIGRDSVAYYNGGISLGYGALGYATDAISIGQGSNTTGVAGVSIALYSSATGDYSIAIGEGSNITAAGGNGIAIGKSAYITGNYGIAIGYNALALATNTLALGNYSYVNAIGAIGILANSRGVGSVGIGKNGQVDGDYSVIVGYNNDSNADNGIAIGTGISQHDGNQSVLIGDGLQSTANAVSAIGIGTGVVIRGAYQVAIGHNAECANATSKNIALGYDVNNTVSDSIKMGWANTAGNYMQMADFSPNIGVKTGTHSIPVTLDGATYYILLSNV